MPADVAVLEYEQPIGSGEIRVRPGDPLTIEVGPVQDSLLVATLVPQAFAFVFTAGVCVYGDTTVVRRIGMALAAVAIAFITGVMLRHRRMGRTLVVSAGVLYLATPLSGGKLLGLPTDKPWRFKVRRRWYWPWHLRLEARQIHSFWSLHRAGATEPIELVSGLARADLQRIAGELRAALPNAQ